MSVVWDGRGYVVATIPRWRRYWPTITAVAAVSVAMAMRLFVPGQWWVAIVWTVAVLVVFVPEAGDNSSHGSDESLARQLQRRAERAVAKGKPPTVRLIDVGPGTTRLWPIAVFTVAAVAAVGPGQVVLGAFLVLLALTFPCQLVTLARTSDDAVTKLARNYVARVSARGKAGVEEHWKQTIANPAWGAGSAGPGAKRRGAKSTPGVPVGGPLPRTKLTVTHYDDVTDSWRGRLHLGAGRLTIDDALKAVPLIAKAWDVSADLVHVRKDPKSEARAYVWVYKSNPLHRTYEWQGPSYKNGEIVLGYYANGQPAKARLWRPSWGVKFSRVTGNTGGGKSSTSEVIGAELLLWGAAVVIVIDPQGGSSLPFLSPRAHYLADDIESARRMLRAVHAVMRSRERRKRPKKPSRAHPLFYVIIEEAPSVLADKECAALVEEIAKQVRKVWGAVAIVAQHYTAGETGGSALRSQLGNGIVALFAQTEPVTGPAAPSKRWPGVEPEKLPPPDEETAPGVVNAGTCYLPMCGSTLPARHIHIPEASAEIFDTIAAELEPPAGWSPADLRAFETEWPEAPWAHADALAYEDEEESEPAAVVPGARSAGDAHTGTGAGVGGPAHEPEATAR